VIAPVLWHWNQRTRDRATCSFELSDGWRKSGSGGSNGGIGPAAELAEQEEGGVVTFELDDMQVIQASDGSVPLRLEGFFSMAIWSWRFRQRARKEQTT
jgi:hypothetical protein